MSLITRESKINVGNKELQVDEVLKTLIYLPVDKMNAFFDELGLKFPRELRMHALKENLREKVAETRKSRLTMADEINYRLSWFAEYTESQLENLVVFFNDERIYRNYLEDLWTNMIRHMVEKHVLPKDLKALVDLSVDHVRKNDLVLPNIRTFNPGIKGLFYDSFDRIDGLSQNKIRPVLYKSSTLTEIRGIGTKYGVNVPRRLKKRELADIIIRELKDTNRYTEELEQKINGMSVIIMQRFAIDNDIKASTELKKEEIIEYILKNAEQTKETYFEPGLDDYEKEVHEVIEEKVAEEPQVETPIEPEDEEQVAPEVVKIEEPVIEEPVETVETKVEAPEEPVQEPVVIQSNLNLDALVEEVRKLREAIEHQAVSQEQSSQQPVDKAVEIETDAPKPSEPVQINERIIVNTAEFVGDKKAYKQLHKLDEADEREAFIEQRKQENEAMSSLEEMPAEAKLLGKFFKGTGKVLWKILKVLLKIALIIALIGVILLLVYAVLTHYVELTFLDGITDALNGLLTINGEGLIDYIHGLFESIGM